MGAAECIFNIFGDNNATLAHKLKSMWVRMSPKCEKEKWQKSNRLKATNPQLLQLMPRCSSFGSMHAPSTAPTQKAISDPSYTLWKSMFDEARAGSPLNRRLRRHRLDITEALSGQLTPKGFPSYTHVTNTQQSGKPQRTMTRAQRERSNDTDSLGSHLKICRRLSLRLPKFAAGKSKNLPKCLKQQTKPTKDLYAEIKDLEEYCGLRWDYFDSTM